MPIPLGYSRATFYGHLPGGEIFNVSLWTDQAPSDQGAAQTMATSFANTFKTQCNTPPASTIAPSGMMDSLSGYDGCRVYSYTDASGKAQYIGDATVGVTGSNTSGGQNPLQTCFVATLRTAVAGRSATGRVFVPAPRYSIQAGGQVGSSDCLAIATWWSKLITALNATMSGQHVVVLSQKTGLSHSVNSVTVDSKPDIQRRRANKLVPTYRSTVVVT